MIRKQPLTIEIRRDSATPGVCLDGVSEGIATMREIYSGIKLINNGELMYLADHAQDSLDFRTIANTYAGSDMLMVLTDRPFHDSREGRYVFGKTFNYFDRNMGSIAVIDALNSGKFMPKVVAHEGFHLFGAKESGEFYDGNSHCTQENCLMIPEVSESNHECDECALQFEKSAYEKATEARRQKAACIGRVATGLRNHCN